MSALLALSDLLVVRALERACSRGLSGDARRAARRHVDHPYRAYEAFKVPPTRVAYALEEAWTMTTPIVDRWQLPIEPGEWAHVLDLYARGLLTRQAPHTLDSLDAALALLGAGHAV